MYRRDFVRRRGHFDVPDRSTFDRDVSRVFGTRTRRCIIGREVEVGASEIASNITIHAEMGSFGNLGVAAPLFREMPFEFSPYGGKIDRLWLTKHYQIR